MNLLYMATQGMILQNFAIVLQVFMILLFMDFSD